MTPEEITSLFATAAASFQPIIGQPTDDDLTALRDVIYPLLIDIPYTEYAINDPAATAHNLIGLIEPTATYTARWHEPFPTPVRPPAYPAIPNDATAVVRARSEAEHAIIVKDFTSYEAAERAVAKFIREAVDEIWYRDLRQATTYYTNVTAKQLMDHLTTNCGGLHPSELISLPTEMISYYTEAEGIPEYINMMEDAQRKLARANLPMSDDQLVAIASTAVLASNHFPRPTDEWEARPRAEKTWTEWKLHYRAAHLARKRQLLASGKTPTTYGSANAATAAFVTPTEDDITLETFAKLDGYLDNLAAAASTEKTTLNQLIENNATLTANVTSLTASIAALTAAYATLAGKATPTAPGVRNKKAASFLAAGGYCWTHGYRVKQGHDSTTCRDKAPGHKDAATRANTMNGSTNNKGWDA